MRFRKKIKLKAVRLDKADKDVQEQFIKKLRDNDFTYLAGKPPTKEEIDQLEKELLGEDKEKND